MIKLICVGRLKDVHLQKLCQEYEKRIGKYHRFIIKEIPWHNDLAKEAKAINKIIDNDQLVIVLNEKGAQYTSKEFSDFIAQNLATHSKITFIIGGANGLAAELLKNKKMSFSVMTFPHQLFRLIFLEQLYRAFTILNNEKYHK